MRVQIPLTCTSNKVVVLQVVEPINNHEEQQINDPITHNEIETNESVIEEPQQIALRRPQRERKSAISNDYVVYLQESELDLRIENDPVTFSQAINSDNADKWLNAMKDELQSMKQNEVWDLVELPKSCKRVGCKWVFKTKRDSYGNLER